MKLVVPVIHLERVEATGTHCGIDLDGVELYKSPVLNMNDWHLGNYSASELCDMGAVRVGVFVGHYLERGNSETTD